ncbi:MAG: FKBP-type peptidyl-prolyl cis-trans isomerase [Chitinophagaceae bacterium]
MKSVNYFLGMIAAAAMMASCNSVSYQKTKSGLLYKIISSNTKDSIAKTGDWLKVQFSNKINDSSLNNSYGKMPGYAQVVAVDKISYDVPEIFPLLRKGDSAIIVLMVDSLLKKNPNGGLPPFMKKGDRLVLTLKVLDVFRDEALYQADRKAETEKDRPRAMKEQEEQMAKMLKEQNEMKLKEELEMEKSGEAAKGIAAMEAYLKGKSIAAQKVGKGTFVVIKEQGAGPMADSGKYVTVKYTGRTLDKDSVFDSGTYPLQLGTGRVIAGWDEGLQSFRQGGKGTLYVPGFRAYGRNHAPAFKDFEAMIFDIEMLNVSDTMPAQAPQPMPQRRN